DDKNAFLSGVVDINIADADSGPGYHLQVLGAVDDLFVDIGLATGHQYATIRRQAKELFAGAIRRVNDAEIGARLKRFDRRVVQVPGNKYARDHPMRSLSKRV